MNMKEQGEESVRIAIGELAKFHISAAVLLTDNEPFDLIVIVDGRLFKAQVKSSGVEADRDVVKNSVKFKCSTSNWHKKTTKKYKKGDFDLMICVDMRDFSVYLVEPEKVMGKRTFQIRLSDSKNGQKKFCNMRNDYLLSKERIKSIFG